MNFEEPGLKFTERTNPDMLIPEILMQIRWNQPELADFKRLWNCIYEVRVNRTLKATGVRKGSEDAAQATESIEPASGPAASRLKRRPEKSRNQGKAKDFLNKRCAELLFVEFWGKICR